MARTPFGPINPVLPDMESSRLQGCNANGEPMSSAYVRHSHPGSFNDEPSKTKQEFAEECDINALMARYEKTGVISHMSRSEPRYLDVSEVPDLALAMQMMSNAEAAFMDIPASVRFSEFGNDPLRFVEFAQDPANADRLVELGFAERPAPAPGPIRVEMVNLTPEVPSAPPKAPEGA